MATGAQVDRHHSCLPSSEDSIGPQGTITLPYAIVTGMAATNTQLIAEVARLQGEVARLKAPQDTELHAEITRLHAEVSRLAGIQTPNYGTPGGEPIESTGDGSGAWSPEAFQAIRKRNWHGRLGRTHMADVDRLSEVAKKELDDFLRQQITLTVPVNEAYCEVSPYTVFSSLSDFGLRLEDRGPFADAPIFHDSSSLNAATVARLRNWAACFYKGGSGNYDMYWKASALETLIELAQYRGLFNTQGFLKDVD